MAADEGGVPVGVEAVEAFFLEREREREREKERKERKKVSFSSRSKKKKKNEEKKLSFFCYRFSSDAGSQPSLSLASSSTRETVVSVGS